MREYTLVITGNRTYKVGNDYPERTWSLSIYGNSPFTMERAFSKVANYNQGSNFNFNFINLEPQQRTLSGTIVFKPTQTKNAEENMQDFIAFSSVPNLDLPFMKLNTGASYKDFQLDGLKKFFQRKILRSYNSDTDETREIYVDSISLTKIQRYGAYIVATLSMVATSLWFEEFSLQLTNTEQFINVVSEAPTSVSYQIANSSIRQEISVFSLWHSTKSESGGALGYFDRKNLEFKGKFEYGFVGNVRGVDLAIKDNDMSGSLMGFLNAYQNLTFGENYRTNCVVNGGDVLQVTGTNIYETNMWSAIYYDKKYWSD